MLVLRRQPVLDDPKPNQTKPNQISNARTGPDRTGLDSVSLPVSLSDLDARITRFAFFRAAVRNELLGVRCFVVAIPQLDDAAADAFSVVVKGPLVVDAPAPDVAHRRAGVPHDDARIGVDLSAPPDRGTGGPLAVLELLPVQIEAGDVLAGRGVVVVVAVEIVAVVRQPWRGAVAPGGNSGGGIAGAFFAVDGACDPATSCRREEHESEGTGGCEELHLDTVSCCCVALCCVVLRDIAWQARQCRSRNEAAIEPTAERESARTPSAPE